MEAYQIPRELFDAIGNTSHRTSSLFANDPRVNISVGIQKYGNLLEVNFQVNGQIVWVLRFTPLG